MKYIVKGRIIDHDNNDREYVLKGVKVRGKDNGMVVCGGCGKHYRRKITKTGPVWICSTFNTMGKAYCPSKQIPENSLISITEEVLGSTDTLYDKITAIRAEKDNTLVFCFKDGSETVKRWQDRSRAESWTEEMKDAAR